MFESLLEALREEGVPVATDEWLALQQALSLGLAGSSLTGLHGLARAVLVKSERHYDAFDVAFLRLVGEIEPASPEIADHVLRWLSEHPGLPAPSAELRARLEAARERLDMEEMRRRLAERLENQTGAHRGGSRHIGTGGTSPFGHSGHHPGGIRVGGEGRARSAAQVAAERRHRDLRTDVPLGVREMGVALRRLRHLSTRVAGPARELDLDATVRDTADAGGQLRLRMRRPRRNDVRVLLLLDVGGSMDEHVELVDRLFTAVHQASHFRDLAVRYFHNCVYDRLYRSARLDPRDSEPTLGTLAQLSSEYKLVVVGDACMAPSELALAGGALDLHMENLEPGWVWLERLAAHFTRAAWLNPVPARWWPSVHGSRTLNAVREVFPMHELTVDGLGAAVDGLMARG
jgi:uncharacterized protein